MPAFQYIEDMDSLFESLSFTPIVVNDVDSIEQRNKQKLKELIYSRFKDELISCIPKCECGTTYGADRLGQVCQECGHPVTDPLEQTIESVVWMRCPQHMRAFFNPMVLYQLRARFNKSGFNYIDWLINPHYRPTVPIPAELQKLINNGLRRGYNNFVDNFDDIFYKLLQTQCTKANPPEEDDLYKEIQQYRPIIFCRYITIPNRSLTTVDDSPTGTYASKDMGDCLEAAALMCGIDTALKKSNESKQIAAGAKAQIMLCNHQGNIYKNIYNKKSGLPRKHIYGGRIMFSARGVIVSINKRHKYDELHMSWNIGIHLMYIHLMSKLLKAPYHMTPRAARHLIYSSTDNYNETIAKLLDELIEESGDGIACIFQRNPSLQRGSVQKRRITQFKKDPTDNTIACSPYAVKAHNADYDGDEMNVFLALDDKTAEAWIELEPHKAMFDINKYRTISNDSSWIKPTTSIANNWLLDTLTPTDEQLEFMHKLSRGIYHGN